MKKFKYATECQCASGVSCDSSMIAARDSEATRSGPQNTAQAQDPESRLPQAASSQLELKTGLAILDDY